MTKEQARALLALLADLYLICQAPDPQPEPAAANGRVAKEPVAAK